jgi:RNA polymerase sigma-70 factor, ECF subfamily
MDLSEKASLSESEVVRRALLGEEAAWELVMMMHQEPVFRFAYLLLGDPVDAEDIAQETFIRAYRAFDRFDEQRALRPWLLSITANLARNRRRSLGRYRAALSRLFHAGPANSASIEERSARNEENLAVLQAIQRLPESDQQVIYLRYFLDLSVGEVAEAAEIAPGTVKSRLHRSLKRLRDILERDLPEYWKEWKDG